MKKFRTNPNLVAKHMDGVWMVEDKQGGTWIPNDEAATQIIESADPAAEAIDICENEPMSGTWKQ